MDPLCRHGMPTLPTRPFIVVVIKRGGYLDSAQDMRKSILRVFMRSIMNLKYILRRSINAVVFQISSWCSTWPSELVASSARNSRAEVLFDCGGGLFVVLPSNFEGLETCLKGYICHPIQGFRDLHLKLERILKKEHFVALTECNDTL